MINPSSTFIKGGGGSWEYIPYGAKTIWIQTNTIVLKDNFICLLIRIRPTNHVFQMAHAVGKFAG